MQHIHVFVYLFTHAQHVIKHPALQARPFRYGTYYFSVQKRDKRGSALLKNVIVIKLMTVMKTVLCLILRCYTEASAIDSVGHIAPRLRKRLAKLVSSSWSLDWQPWKLLIVTIRFLHIISVFAPVEETSTYSSDDLGWTLLAECLHTYWKIFHLHVARVLLTSYSSEVLLK